MDGNEATVAEKTPIPELLATLLLAVVGLALVPQTIPLSDTALLPCDVTSPPKTADTVVIVFTDAVVTVGGVELKECSKGAVKAEALGSTTFVKAELLSSIISACINAFKGVTALAKAELFAKILIVPVVGEPFTCNVTKVVLVLAEGAPIDAGDPIVSVIKYPSIVGCATSVPLKKVELAAPPKDEVIVAVTPSGTIIVNP